jgi:hypothetical protein
VGVVVRIGQAAPDCVRIRKNDHAKGIPSVTNKLRQTLGEFAGQTALGGILGGVPFANDIPGITSGRGSLSSLAKQMITKFQKGQISNVTLRTAARMFAGRSTDFAFFRGGVASTLLDNTLFDNAAEPGDQTGESGASSPCGLGGNMEMDSGPG